MASLRENELAFHYASIEDDNIKAIECLCTLRKGCDADEHCLVKFPDLNLTLFVFSTLKEFPLGRLALLLVAVGEYDAAKAMLDQLSRGFEAKSYIGTSDDGRFPREIDVGGNGRGLVE